MITKWLFAAFSGVGLIVLGFVNAPQIRAQSPSASEAPSLSFDVVSIRPFRTYSGMTGCTFMPGRYSCKNAAVKWIIVQAYNVLGMLISGGPNWASSDPYDIEAKESDALYAALEKLPREQRLEKQRLLIQSMLADRFHLKVHRETKELPVYALVVAKNGPKLKTTNHARTQIDALFAARVKGGIGIKAARSRLWQVFCP